MENVGGRDIRTLFRRAGRAADVVESVLRDTSLPSRCSFGFSLDGGGGGGRGGTSVSVAASSSNTSLVVSYEETEELSSMSDLRRLGSTVILAGEEIIAGEEGMTGV